MTESQPLTSNTSEAAKARYRCWETILTEEGDESLQTIDADLIMTAAVLGFSERLLAQGYPVEFFSDATEAKKVTKSKSAVAKINWVLGRKDGKVEATDPTKSDTMEWKHGSVITGARGKAGDSFDSRHKTPRDFPENSAAREFFEILSHPKEGMIWGYQGRGAYTGYVVDSKGGSMTSSYRSNAPANKTRWVPKDFCEDQKTWGLITGREILKPEKETKVWVRDVDGKLKEVDLGYGHGGMKQQDTETRAFKLSPNTLHEMSNTQCHTGSGSGPSVLPDEELGKSRLVGYTHGMIQAIYMCEERELDQQGQFTKDKVKLATLYPIKKDDLADLNALLKLRAFARGTRTYKTLESLVNLPDVEADEVVKNETLRKTLKKYKASGRKERAKWSENAELLERCKGCGSEYNPAELICTHYDGEPFEIAVGAHTRKLASCFPCTLFMYAANYPPSAIHLGKGESWLPFYPSKGSKGLTDSAISNTNKKWHKECRQNLAKGLEILKRKQDCLEAEHVKRLGDFEKYLGEHTSGEQAANLILDAITVHDSEDARINRTIKDPPKQE